MNKATIYTWQQNYLGVKCCLYKHTTHVFVQSTKLASNYFSFSYSGCTFKNVFFLVTSLNIKSLTIYELQVHELYIFLFHISCLMKNIYTQNMGRPLHIEREHLGTQGT